MIKEMLERRRNKKRLQTFRDEMAAIGIFTYHLTDDEIIAMASKWAARMSEALESVKLSAAGLAEGMQRLGEALEHLKHLKTKTRP